MDPINFKEKPKTAPKPPALPHWPQKVWDVFRCPECGRGLVKTKAGRKGYWTCNRMAALPPVHVGLIPELEIVRRLDIVLHAPGPEIMPGRGKNKGLSARVMQLRKYLALARRLSKRSMIPSRKGKK